MRKISIFLPVLLIAVTSLICPLESFSDQNPIVFTEDKYVVEDVDLAAAFHIVPVGTDNSFSIEDITPLAQDTVLITGLFYGNFEIGTNKYSVSGSPNTDNIISLIMKHSGELIDGKQESLPYKLQLAGIVDVLPNGNHTRIFTLSISDLYPSYVLRQQVKFGDTDNYELLLDGNIYVSSIMDDNSGKVLLGVSFKHTLNVGNQTLTVDDEDVHAALIQYSPGQPLSVLKHFKGDDAYIADIDKNNGTIGVLGAYRGHLETDESVTNNDTKLNNIFAAVGNANGFHTEVYPLTGGSKISFPVAGEFSDDGTYTAYLKKTGLSLILRGKDENISGYEERDLVVMMVGGGIVYATPDFMDNYSTFPNKLHITNDQLSPDLFSQLTDGIISSDELEYALNSVLGGPGGESAFVGGGGGSGEIPDEGAGAYDEESSPEGADDSGDTGNDELEGLEGEETGGGGEPIARCGLRDSDVLGGVVQSCKVGNSGKVCTSVEECPKGRCLGHDKCSVQGTGKECIKSSECLLETKCAWLVYEDSNGKKIYTPHCATWGDGMPCTYDDDCKGQNDGKQRCSYPSETCSSNGTGKECTDSKECELTPFTYHGPTCYVDKYGHPACGMGPRNGQKCKDKSECVKPKKKCSYGGAFNLPRACGYDGTSTKECDTIESCFLGGGVTTSVPPVPPCRPSNTYFQYNGGTRFDTFFAHDFPSGFMPDFMSRRNGVYLSFEHDWSSLEGMLLPTGIGFCQRIRF